MKVILTILLSLFLLTGCDEESSFYDLISDKIHSLNVKIFGEEISIEDLVERDGLTYKKFLLASNSFYTKNLQQNYNREFYNG